MNKLTVYILTLASTFVYGQETKKIIDKDRNETYYVLKSDKTTKHGEYKKMSLFNSVLIKGSYKQGIKDSIWSCYGLDGKLLLQYDYTNSSLISYNSTDTTNKTSYRLINPTSNLDTVITRPPIYLNGDGFIKSEIIKSIGCPANFPEKGKTLKINVLFKVDKLGIASDFYVKNPIGYGLDEATISAFKLLPNKWIPGLVDKQPVDIEVTYPVKFRFQ